MAWIESHQELGAHPKTQKLARILGLSKPTVVGHLHYLWWWATDYAQDGDLSRFDALDIAIGAEWEGNPDLFLDALIRSGFVDQGDAMTIHNWDDYAGKLIERRAKNAERMREARADTKQERATHVQGTQRARARLQNRTEPNQTNNQPSVERDAPTPIKALPRNGPAQSIVAAWYDAAGGKPVSYPKAVGLGQKLAELGCNEGEVAELYDWMGEQEFFQGKWDMGTAVTQFEKFRQSKKPRRRTGAGSGIPA
jgi:hypothetical protein